MQNPDYSTLLIIGLSLVLGTAAAFFLKKIRVPGIVAFIITGFLIGKSGLDVIDTQAIQILRPFNYFALSIIGFTIGGELKHEVFKKYGKNLLKILTFEGAGAFLSVFAIITLCGLFLIDDIKITLALALLLGAVAAATDPASPLNIIWETKSRGPLSTNIMGIVALDDGFALFLFAVASSIAGKILRAPHLTGHPILVPAYEIMGAAVLGFLAGLVLILAIDRLKSREGTAGFSLGVIILTAGISIAAGLNMILALMSAGFTVVNLRPEKSKQLFRIVKSATGPIFVLFFVLVGASIETNALSPGAAVLIAAYLTGMISGKLYGTRIGARLAGSPAPIYTYLPYCLFAQAGVAIGLTILAAQTFPGEISRLMITVVTPAVLILQIFAPFATKISLQKARETGLNITEEELLENVTVRELYIYAPPGIRENTSMNEILKLFSEGDNFYYPVVTRNGSITGIISVEGLKAAIMEHELRHMLLAADIMEPVPVVIGEETPLSEAKKIMEKYAIEFLPVTSAGEKLQGFIEERMIKKFISSKLLEMKQRAAELEKEKNKPRG